MASQLMSNALSFSNIECFIRAYQSGATGTEPSFELIDQALTLNKPLLTAISQFSETTSDKCSTEPKIVESLILRGTTYNKVSTKSCEQAFVLSKQLGLNYNESLRVIIQTKLKIDDNVPTVALARYVFQERNSVLQTILLLLNNSEIPVIQGKFIQFYSEKKFEVCEDLIRLLEKIIFEFDDNNPDLPVDLSERELEELMQLKNSQNLIYATNILKVLTNIILNASIPTNIVKLWFAFLDNSRHRLHNMINSSSTISEVITDKIEALVTANTLLMLGLDSTSSSVNFDAPYYKDPDCFKKIHAVLEGDLINPVIIYMWSFILFAKSYTLEETPEAELDFVQNVFGKKPISKLTASYASRAEEAGVFDAIKKMSKALSTDKFYSVIISSFLTFSLNFIPLNVQTSEMIKAVLLETPKEFVERFLTSREFEKKLTILKAKLPLIEEALLPLLNISAVHVQFANFEWNDINTYTGKFKLGELDYDIVDDTENSVDLDLIVLKKETFVKPPLEFDQNILMPIPEDTRGKILPTPATSDEDVIVFLYKYNGWSLLGRILQNICEKYVANASELDEPTRKVMISIIELVSNAVSTKTPMERSTEILQHLSGYVTDEDIVSVVFRIFEHSMHRRNYEVISICSEFLSSLFANFPHFVWSHLARSDLLNRYGKTGLASTILGSIELSSGRYDFTISLIKLANDMVIESLELEAEFPPRTKTDLLDKLIAHLLDVSESYQFWKYADVMQRFEIGFHLNSLFTKILYNVYGIDPHSAPKDKVTSTLASSGARIINAFLGSQSPDVRAAKSLLNILLSSENSQILLLGDPAFGYAYTRLVKHSFELASLLISIRGLLQMNPSSLERMIYAKSSNLVDIYNSEPCLKRYIIKLFHSLVKVPWTDNYLFLLSYLGERHSEIFLNSISFDLEGPLGDHKLLQDMYMFFSALMESKQDGLSILFLTGDIASNKAEQPKSKVTRKKSILSILKKNALNLDVLPESVGCSLLDAIAYAFNTWAHAKDSNADTEFIIALMKRVKEFKPTKGLSKEGMFAISGKYQLISRIIEIFALYLFTSSEVDSHIFQLLNQQNLATLVNPFFEIDGYNKSLHEDLHRRFEEKWPKLKLSRFSVAPLFQSGSYSRNSIFAISLMDQFFDHDEKWTGSKSIPGYRAEVIEASLNLNYVTHQIAAAKAWGALLTTFVKKTSQPLNDTYIDITSNFLKVNIDCGIEAPLFAQVYCERLELCFYIFYSLQKKTKQIPEKVLLKLVQQLITVFKSDEVDYLGNISHSTRRNFYRPILRSILLLLSFVTNGTHFVEIESDQLLEFFELSFCKGVHLILSEMLSDISTSTSNGRQVVIFNIGERVQDLFLLLSLFTKIKALKPTDNFNLILASSLNEIGTLKVILNLYSSSHLFKVNDEAILGPLILTFVSELCTINHVATKFISNGLFAVLLESPLSLAIQAGDIKPETQSSLHNIWTNGLLSIILLLLSEFGVKVLPESCLFVSFFSKQVKTAIFRWSDSKLAVSTALIRETSQLVLLQKMLSTLDYQHYLTNSNARALQSEDEEDIELVVGLDTEQKRRALSVALNRLLTHPKYLNSRVVPTTVEEQQLSEDDTTRIEFVKEIYKRIKGLQESLFKEI